MSRETSHKTIAQHPIEHRASAPTVLVNEYLGNIGAIEDLRQKVEQAKENNRCLEVMIGRDDRQKGRILTRLSAEQTVGIVKGRDWLLRDGDVMRAKNELAKDELLVLIRLHSQQLMALRFAPESNNRAIALVRLGHMLGNHHWPITIQEDVLYVELVAEAALMESVVNEMAETLGIEGLSVGFEARSPEEALNFSPELTTKHTHH